MLPRLWKTVTLQFEHRHRVFRKGVTFCLYLSFFSTLLQELRRRRPFDSRLVLSRAIHTQCSARVICMPHPISSARWYERFGASLVWPRLTASVALRFPQFHGRFAGTGSERWGLYWDLLPRCYSTTAHRLPYVDYFAESFWQLFDVFVWLLFISKRRSCVLT